MTKRNTTAAGAEEDSRTRTDNAEPLIGAGRESSDDRVLRDSGADVRGGRGFELDPGREEPMSDAELEAMIATEFEQNRLPTPPAMAGWHLCWLTTSSPYDSIHNRQRIGYQLVRTEELKGWDPSAGQSIERYPGVICCNEMVLAKIEERRYQAIMKFLHHKKPLAEEEGILAKIKAQEGQDSAGKKLGSVEGDGITDMEESVKRAAQANPTFS